MEVIQLIDFISVCGSVYKIYWLKVGMDLLGHPVCPVIV